MPFIVYAWEFKRWPTFLSKRNLFSKDKAKRDLHFRDARPMRPRRIALAAPAS
jgi:hypothetical protein